MGEESKEDMSIYGQGNELKSVQIIFQNFQILVMQLMCRSLVIKCLRLIVILRSKFKDLKGTYSSG